MTCVPRGPAVGVIYKTHNWTHPGWESQSVRLIGKMGEGGGTFLLGLKTLSTEKRLLCMQGGLGAVNAKGPPLAPASRPSGSGG